MMETILSNTINKFVDNVEGYKKKFRLQNIFFKRMVALLFALNNKKLDIERLTYCYDLLKRKVKWYSPFRGYIHIINAGLLALEEKPEEFFNRILKIGDDLKKEKIKASFYLSLLAYFIGKGTDIFNYSSTIRRIKTFFQGMKENHLFLTSSRDYVIAGLMAMTESDSTYTLRKAENYYQNLKKKVSINLLTTYILTFNEEPFNLENKLLKINNKLNEKNIKLQKRHVTPALGLLALIPAEIDEIVKNVESVYQQLRKYKMFNNLLISKREVQFYSAIIVAWTYLVSEIEESLADNFKNLIIAVLIVSITAIAMEHNSNYV